MAVVRNLLADADLPDLERTCPQNPAHGYPPETEHRVRTCLWTVMDEEWAHHQFATRDLAALEL
jgi:hypothetical protein